MTAILAVSDGGVYIDLPPPAYAGYTSKPNNLVKSNRNTLGDLYIYRINVKRSIDVEWHGITAEQRTLIASLTEPNTFNVRYYDVFTGTIRFGEFYLGSDAVITPLLRWNGADFSRFDVKMSLVEC